MVSSQNTIKNIANDDILCFDFELNEDLLLLEMERNIHRAKPYIDSRFTTPLNNWLILKAVKSQYVQKLIEYFEVPASPRFYVLEPNSIIPTHTDFGTQCSINFILGDDTPSPITFGDKKYFYKNAILNTKRPHGVINDSMERVTLKLSIFDLTFEETCNKVKKILMTKKWS